MLTSATGLKADNNQLPPGRSSGFSLLEVLVVVVIISIVLSLATLSFDTEPDELDNETQRITALMKLAAEEAVMNSREYRMQLGENDYSFQIFSHGKWRNSTDEIFRRRRLPDGFFLNIEIEHEPVSKRTTYVEDLPLAEILFLSSSEATPFELSITSPTGLTRTISNLDGKISTDRQKTEQP